MNHTLYWKGIFLSLILFLPATRQLQAGEAARKASRRPIETRMEMGLFGILGAGMVYSQDGKKIGTFREFKEILFPLGDPEATRLLHESEEADAAWWVLVAAGTAVGVDIALTYKPVPLFGVDFLDRITSGSVAVQVFLVPATILGGIAASDKYNAVQRYNRLVRKERAEGIRLDPLLFARNNHLGLGLLYSF